jgi:hypothetical protein
VGLRKERKAVSPSSRVRARERENVPESLIWRKSVEGYGVVVRGLRIHSVAPPCLDRVCTNRAILRVLEAEEDDDDAEGESRVESGR